MMGWGGYPGWWPGSMLWAVFMVVCVAVMAHMMGHGRRSAGMGGMHRSTGQDSGRHETDESGQILDRRLARGEIDIQEYQRIQQTLAGAGRTAGAEKSTINSESPQAGPQTADSFVGTRPS